MGSGWDFESSAFRCMSFCILQNTSWEELHNRDENTVRENLVVRLHCFEFLEACRTEIN